MRHLVLVRPKNERVTRPTGQTYIDISPVTETVLLDKDTELKVEYVKWNRYRLRIFKTDKTGLKVTAYEDVRWFIVVDKDMLDHVKGAVVPLMQTLWDLQCQLEDVPDCDNCDERMGDPPDHSWRD